jgi:hypothetical protein
MKGERRLFSVNLSGAFGYQITVAERGGLPYTSPVIHYTQEEFYRVAQEYTF